MYIDTHCHIEDKNDLEVQTMLKEARSAKVSPIILSSSTTLDLDRTLEIAKKYSYVYASIGYHPEVASTVTLDDIKYLESHLTDEKVVAIGEIGLDYHYTKENKTQQETLFRQQLSLAQQYHLPVVIHSREATEDTIRILKDYQVTGSIHCFSGSLETAKQYLKLGYYLGIGGVLTFHNSKLPSVVQEIPLDKILLETDSPYLAPVPFRGKPNASKNIPVIAAKLADIKYLPIETVETITTENAEKLFRF